MPYEIFTRKVTRAGSPTIAFSKSGRLMLNKSATLALEKDHVEHVLALWDKENRKVAIRPITKKDVRAYTLKYANRNAGSYFSAKTFFDYIGVKYDATIAFPAKWVDDGALLEAEIPIGYLKSDTQQKSVEPEVSDNPRRFPRKRLV